jgi:hypothetical protein
MSTFDRRRRPSRAAPRLEMLEDRCLPAIWFNPILHTLFIVGDSGPNKVVITDHGNNLPGAVSATMDGGGPGNSFVSNFVPVHKILVLTGDRNDSVEYNLTGPLGVARAVDANLGRHFDNFTATLGGDLLPGAALQLDVDGGRHSDLIRVDAAADVDVAAGAELRLGLNGGPAGDNVLVQYRGELDGHVVLDADGGPDGANDGVTAQFDLDPGSAGVLEAIERGRLGDDHLRLVIHKIQRTDPAVVRGLIDGGRHLTGDTAVHTANVKTINCEVDMLVS